MTNSDQSKPKFRRRAAARPDEVLDAALALFAEQGYSRTTVDQIARRAGLSKGAVYLYFPSKEAVMAALVTRLLDPIDETMFQAVAAHRGDPLPVLERFLRSIAMVMGNSQSRSVPLMVLREGAAAPEIAALFREAVLDRALPAVTALLAQGVDGGFIRPIDPELTTRTIIGPVLVHMLLSEVFGVTPKDGLNMGKLVDNHLEIVLAGLAPAKGPGG